MSLKNVWKQRAEQRADEAFANKHPMIGYNMYGTFDEHGRIIKVEAESVFDRLDKEGLKTNGKEMTKLGQTISDAIKRKMES